MESNKANANATKVIRITEEQYNELLSRGSMNMSFSEVLSDVMEQAKLMGASASKASEKDK